MINEVIFFLHIFINITLLLVALRYGKITLMVFYAFQVVLANFFVLKQINLFGLHVTASDVFAIGAFFCVNLVREFFDKKTAYNAIWIGFSATLGFVLFSQIHLLYIPNQFDQVQSSYYTLLFPSVRIVIASLITFLIVQRFDVLFFQLLKNVTQGKYLSVRMIICLAISQLCDTVLFSFLGLYGLVESISSIIIMSYLIKIIITLIVSPFTYFSKKIIKQNAII